MDSTFGGLNFAPTGDNATMGGKNAQLAGVPQAMQVISMALPRVLGAKPIAPGALMSSPGSQGNPVDSALWQTILKTLGLAPQQMGLPGGTAGPNQPVYPNPQERGPELPYAPPADPRVIPGGGGSQSFDPHIVFQPNEPSAPGMRPGPAFRGGKVGA